MTIAGQQNGLAVVVTVGAGGRIKTLPFTIETKPVFDGKSLLGNASVLRLSRHQQVSWPLTVKAVMNRRKNLDAYRHRTAQSQAKGQALQGFRPRWHVRDGIA
ncbi:hypothetical protein CXK95_13420 [Stutzerimonas degradans]|uniref:Uncharacterized protein n=1 Tax=Stutzerimonas degradans TaxID=2968968 RepID=A0A8E2U3J4_9GAMM|nr:hypothetical protein CXK95_13420 [Stutzerimonas degradans]